MQFGIARGKIFCFKCAPRPGLTAPNSTAPLATHRWMIGKRSDFVCSRCPMVLDACYRIVWSDARHEWRPVCSDCIESATLSRPDGGNL